MTVRFSRPAVLAGIVLALGALVGAAGTAGSAGASPASHRSQAASHYVTARQAMRGGQIHGMAINPANRPFRIRRADVVRLARDGINTIDIYITEYQAGPEANKISKGPNTPTTPQVEAAVKLIHQHHMAVELMPVVWTSGAYYPRNEYQPKHVARWFASYTRMIDRWASVARRSHSEIFSVGSEYSYLQPYTSRWRKVIRTVRTRYHGEVTYMADANTIYDHAYDPDAPENPDVVKFWSSVDDIGVSPYFTVSFAAIPRVAKTMHNWLHNQFGGLYDLVLAYHRPVLFNELGYQSIRKTAWNPYQARNGTPSERAQATAYNAVIKATTNVSWLRGLVFFTWGTESNSPHQDTTYDPEYKQAECVMARSWAKRTTRGLTACQQS